MSRTDCNNKILQQSNVKGNICTMPKERCKTLDDINDILIVQKITEVDPTNTTSNEIPEAKECLCFKTICDCEKYWLAEEQEAIIRKQLQMLQADERGKQALISEIAALKQSQERKAELIRNRQRARDVENERAKKIASLPPPLPKSVKSLLKKYDDEPKTSKPEVQMPDELKTIKIKPIDPSRENKENILDSEEIEAKQKMQEEWQVKAKKRFNEALKKDRQKEEYSNIMKQIQNAELQNRREMAKNVSSDKKGMPCPLSDKYQLSKKQADMEEAAEKLFKKISSKEHAIEDVEGYQDHYEDKYKRIDSNYESKMIDCVPDFVKENYEYLLEDDSKFQGGKNFELDENGSDILNIAYIESPPGIDEHDGSEKIDLAISHLDKLRSHIQTEYEQTFKPLLMASLAVPKKSDKAVETDLIKLPAEDKAVETDMQFKDELTSPSPPPTFDFKTAGVMAYKRRHLGPILSSYRNLIVPDMHQRDVHYIIPSVTHSEDLATGSWSSSSYCSLPSKHGIPVLPNETESVKCDICVAEMKDDIVKEVPLELSPTFVSSSKKSDKSIISTEKPPLSEYVQQLAEKYLLAKSSKSNHILEESVTKAGSGSGFPMHLKTDSVSPAFEKEVICKSKVGLFVDQHKSKELAPTLVKESTPKETVPKSLSTKDPDIITKEKISIPDSVETSVKTNEMYQDKEKEEHLKEDVYDQLRNYELSKSPIEYSDYDLEAKRIQAIHQVLARRNPCSTRDFSMKPTENRDLKNENEPESSTFLTQNRLGVKTHVYHELSTIQELDSALTAGSIHFSHSKLSDASETKEEKDSSPQKKSKEDLGKSAERLKMASLLDPPDSEISQLAKSIHFVESRDKAVTSLQPKSFSAEGLNVMSVSSKENLSTPSLVTDSDSSVPLHEKVFSSTLSGSHIKHPFLKDVSAIPQKVSDSEKSVSSATLSESIPSFPAFSSTQSFSPVSHNKINKKENTMSSIISGYISDVETPERIKSDISYPTQENKDTIVSGYISDIEVPSISKSGISHAIQEKKNTLHSIESGYIRDLGTPNVSKSGNFYPMTPRSDISSPVVAPVDSNFGKDMKSIVPKDDVLLHSSSPESFKPMTPHSNISSPTELPFNFPQYKHQDFASSTESFKALTPHSNISTPTEFGAHASKYEQQGFTSSAESFKALTSHSNISTPTELGAHASKYEHQGFTSSSESFKALTPHSNISSPNEFSKYERQTCGSSPENFRALTPKSIIAPSSHYDESELQCKKNSGSSDFRPVTIRLTNIIPADSLASHNDKLTEPKKLSHISYNLTLKTQISNSPDNILKSKASGQKQITVNTNQKDVYLNEMNNAEFPKENPGKSGVMTHTSPSDFFIPHVKDLPDFETKDDCGLAQGTLTTVSEKKEDKLKSTFDSQLAVISSCGSESKNNLPEEDTGTAFSSSEEILAQNMKEKPASEISKEAIKNQNLHNLAERRGYKKQYINLQAVSSTSSSTENLSEISESKVLYQSTPVKNFSEIIQEPGIMEEPDLTLYTTKLSCKIGSPMKKRDPSTSCVFDYPTIKEQDNMITPPQSACRTPVSQSPQLLATPDTPSMLSFLHHEMSCMQTEDAEVHLSAEDLNKMHNVPESKTSSNQKEVKRSPFPRSEYKQRTKRLWNNLEEVRKKNLEEERKRIMEVNRLKAKKFAKKLTPKNKGK